MEHREVRFQGEAAAPSPPEERPAATGPSKKRSGTVPTRFAKLAEEAEPLTKPKQHPMFMTTSNSIGASSISQETLPLVYYPKSNKFSKDFNVMYRNYGLNTTLSKSNFSELE